MDTIRGPGKAISATTTLEKKLLVSVGVLIVIGIGLIIGIIHQKQSYDDEFPENSDRLSEGVCFSPTCITEAASLTKSMDTTVDPCTDFYTFVCGNWIKNNYLVSSLESQFLNMAKTIVLRVKEILGAILLKTDLPLNQQKTADFYRSCMNDDQRNKLGAEELISDLTKFGGWPLIDENWTPSSFDWADLMIQLFKNGYLSNMLISVKVSPDVKNTSTSLLEIDQPSLGLFKQLYYDLEIKSILDSYKLVILKLAKLLGNDMDVKNEDIEDAFQIEYKIASAMENVDLRYLKSFYHIMTLKEVENIAPKIPWRKIFRGLLPSRTSISDDERIMVTSVNYIKKLNSILQEYTTRPKSLANFMFYRVVLNAAHFLSTEYSSIVNELFETARGGSPMQWEECAAVTLQLFPLPLSATYVKWYTTNNTKRVLGMMVEDLRNSIKDRIEGADWLDTETKNNALRKVEKMKAAIGYPDEIMNDENLNHYCKNITITDNYFKNIKQVIAFRKRQSMKGLHEKRFRFRWYDEDDLLTANAYYRQTENTITIPVGVLQDAVFAADRPNYINYGSLGMIVGHELTHAFDSIGSLYDADGNYRNWWTETSYEDFRQKIECYEEQYSNYFVPEAKTHIDGELTLAENIADNGGLKAAYYAYNTLLARIGSEKSLPGLLHYTEKQMFWIAFASVWCQKQTDESIVHALKHDVHAIPKFRVIGSLSNIPEFSEDFHCDLYSDMNPVTKCYLWN